MRRGQWGVGCAVVLAALFFGAGFSARAADGDFVWAGGMGGTGSDFGVDIAVDSSGNVYTTGLFQGTVDFDPGAGTSNLTSAGLDDVSVSKLDGSGNFVWAKAMGGASVDAGLGIAVDGPGNVYTIGSFAGTVDFDPGAGTSNLASAGSDDVFVSKLDSSGAFVWAKAMGGTSLDGGLAIAVDGSGNVYTTGYFNSTADFDPGAGTSNLNSAGLNDVFVSKLDSSGNFVWAKAMGGTSVDAGLGIALGNSDNVYTTGLFQGTVDFDPGAGTSNLGSAGVEDIFVSKLDSSGAFVWAKAMGGTSTDFGDGIAVDSSSNVYTTGRFGGTGDFDPGAGTSNLTSAGSWDVFVSKLDSSGAFVWAKAMGSTAPDQGQGIAVDGPGNVYTTGYFDSMADFDPGAGTSNLTSTGGRDVFVSKLDSSGNLVWAKAMGGTSSDQGEGIAVDSSGNVYTTGRFQGTADFDPGAGTSNLTSAGGIGDADVFVLKLSRETTAPTILLSSTAPNPASAAISVTATLSESSVNFAAVDITPTNTAVSGFAGGGISYSFTLTPTAQGEFSAVVNAGTFTDSATNPNTASNVLGRTYSLAISVDPPGAIIEGDIVELTAPAGTVYQWKRNNVNVANNPPRVTGATGQVLRFDAVLVSDSGSYTVVYDNGAKAVVVSPPFVLVVAPLAPGVPAAGAAGLAALAALIAAVHAVRRRKR